MRSWAKKTFDKANVFCAKNCAITVFRVKGKGIKISKRPPILISPSSQCQRRLRKIAPHLNLYSKFELGVIFCCRFWHQLEDEIKIGGLFETLLPLSEEMCSFIIKMSFIKFYFT